jgi:hypothetical protein
LGNAYLAESGWRPRYLWAAGRRWRLTEYEYNREWGYRSLAYMSRTRSGGRLQVLLTYQWEV